MQSEMQPNLIRNYPPEQKSVQPLPSQTVTLAPSGTVFFVTVRDPEADHVDFTWSTTQAYIGPGTPIQGDDGIVGSQLTLPADAAYDGQVLECTYVDDPADQGIQHDLVTLSWTLAVPAQESP
jgi:hypothetical protein